MTTYVYETVPTPEGEAPEYIENKQSMNDPALTHHPETGQPIRRVILGGIGVLKSGHAKSASDEGCCGGSPGCCG